MPIRRILIFVIILSCVLTLVSCKSTPKKIEPAEIHLLFPTPDDRAPNSFIMDKIYTAVAADFEQENPQIKVVIDHAPIDEFTSTEILKKLKSVDSPDIVPFDIGYLKTAEKEDVLVDLNGLEKAAGSVENDTFEGLSDATQINGKRLVMPYAAIPLVILYNKSFFDDAKLPYPQGDWTWEQFAETSQKMKGVNGSALPFTPFIFDIMEESLGKGMISPEGDTSLGYLDSQQAVDTVKWFNSYYHSDKARDKKNINDDMNAGQQFNNKLTGMTLGALDSYTFFKTNLGDKLGVAPLPHFAAGNRINPIYYLGFGISKNSKHPEAALAFMQYFTFVKHSSMDKLADYVILISKSMSEATHQNTDPIKSIFVNELAYAVKPSSNYNPLLFESWNQQSPLSLPFQDLYTIEDRDIPAKLHSLAQKVDQEIKRFKDLDDAAN